METGEYQIIERPDGQFVLRHDKEQYGPFPNKDAAVAGMKRVINPVIYHYDVDGKSIL